VAPFLPQMLAIGDLEERIHRQNKEKEALLTRLSEEKKSLERYVNKSALDKVTRLVCQSFDTFLQ
jgi:hypothetical protein